MLAGASRTLAIRAATDCEVFEVPAAAVQRMLKERPADWTSFCRLSHQNATLDARSLAELIALPTRARFARLLWASPRPTAACARRRTNSARWRA